MVVDVKKAASNPSGAVIARVPAGALGGRKPVPEERPDDVEDAPLEPAAPVSRAADRRVVATPTVNPVRTLPEPVMPPVDVTKPIIRPVPASSARVHVVEPRGFNEAQEVGDRLKAGQPVIINLQGVDNELKRRLIDFSSGLTYAIGGSMSRVSDQVFLLTPVNTEVSPEEKERLQARGLYRA